MIHAHHLSSLLAATAAGDQRAYRELYESSSPMMFGLLLRMLKSRDLAEEALQDCYINIWRKDETYSAEKGTPLNWLMTVARYRALDQLRLKRREVEMPEDGEEESFLMEDQSQSPEESAIERESLGQLEPCMDKLKHEERQSLLLAYYEGYTHEELSKHLGRPLGTVKNWVRRGLASLRACLENT